MDTTTPPIPIYLRPAERRTGLLGVRVYKDQREQLEINYKGKSSAIVRFLLDEFFKEDGFPELKQILKQP